MVSRLSRIKKEGFRFESEKGRGSAPGGERLREEGECSYGRFTPDVAVVDQVQDESVAQLPQCEWENSKVLPGGAGPDGCGAGEDASCECR